MTKEELEKEVHRLQHLNDLWEQKHPDNCLIAKKCVSDLRSEVKRLEGWVSDLQSGMWINCVYCGHRYGPDDEVPASMAEVLKEHIEQCPEHPMSKLKEENASLKKQLEVAANSHQPRQFSPGAGSIEEGHRLYREVMAKEARYKDENNE